MDVSDEQAESGRQMGMTYASKSENARALWQPQSMLDAARLSHVLYSLLVEPGSLTERLRASCRDTFAVRVLRQTRCRPSDYPEHLLASDCTQALLREVYLQCDGRPAVFAQTLVPAATLAVHPWLAELGGRPLGQALFTRQDVERKPFEFAELGPQQDLAASAVAALAAADKPDGKLWARRSHFMVSGLPVSVNEVFFPPMATRTG